MEVSYRRDLNHNYMIVEDVNLSGREYTARMVEHNDIPGLLHFHRGWINGTVCLYYEISSRQPIARIFENVSMESRDIEAVLSGILTALENAGRYLLNSADFVLDPEYIYMDVDTRHVWLCYVPGLEEEVQDTISSLAEFILKRLEHGDRRAVELGYGLYGQAGNGNISLQEALKQLLSKHSNAGTGSISTTGKESPIEQMERNAEPDYQDLYRDEPKASVRSDALTGKALQAKKKISGKNIVLCTLAVTALVVLFGMVCVLFRLDLTQIGGLAFLLLAVIWMVYGYVTEKKRRKKERWAEDETDEEEEAFLDALMEELYDGKEEYRDDSPTFLRSEQTDHERQKKHRMAQKGIRKKPEEEDRKTMKEKYEEKYDDKYDETFGETRCLAVSEEESFFVLASRSPGRYPDIPLSEPCTVIGKRRGQADVCLPSDAVSRIHAKLEQQGEKLLVTDLNSMNGTFLNGERLKPNECRTAKEGDELKFAGNRYRLEKGGIAENWG